MTQTSDVSRTATTFTVNELVTRAWRGDIRIPHFQRAFRWKRTDAEKLFDSIVKNYPIGSLLLWARPAPARNLKLGSLHIDAPETKEALWVVDGQQRITSLANALSADAQYDPQFTLAYHLREERFLKPRSASDPWAVPLPVLFDGQKVMQWFWERPELNDYFQVASAITQKIREYSVPAYRVEHDDERVLQDIFDRMNNYGKRLTKAEVFTALNAGNEAFASDQLTFPLMATHIDGDRHFGEIDEGTALQAVLARRHPDTQRDIRNEFGRHDSEGRDAAYRAGEQALLRAVAFLQDDAGVPHTTFLPFRYLLVVLARFFAFYPEPSPRNRVLLRRWFWRAAVFGSGGYAASGTAVTRIFCKQITEGDETRSVQALLNALGEQPADSPVPDVSKFRVMSAESKVVLCGWWACGPRDPETGEEFSREELAERLRGQPSPTEAVHTIVPSSALPEETRPSAANRVLLPVLRRDAKEIPDLLLNNVTNLDPSLWAQVQHSHLITPRHADLLSWGDTAQFVTERQKLLHECAAHFLHANCEWTHEDTPPLGDLIPEDDRA